MSRYANVISVRYPVTLRHRLTGIYCRAIWMNGVMRRLKDDHVLGGCKEDEAPDGWEIVPGLTPACAPRKEPRKATMINLAVEARARLERIAKERGASMSDVVNQLIMEVKL